MDRVYKVAKQYDYTNKLGKKKNRLECNAIMKKNDGNIISFGNLSRA